MLCGCGWAGGRGCAEFGGGCAGRESLWKCVCVKRVTAKIENGKCHDAWSGSGQGLRNHGVAAPAAHETLRNDGMLF
eukprot:4502636-Prymnesium_polylepis.1